MTQLFVSKNNTTTNALGANEMFTGAADTMLSFQEIDINVAGSPSNAPGTLYFEFSPDGTNWDVSVPLVLTGPTLVPTILRAILPYFRVRYVNGGTAQTAFRLTTMFHRQTSTRLSRFLSQPIDSNEPTEVVKSILHAQKPDGSFHPVAFGNDDAIKVEGSGVIQPVSGTVAVSNMIPAVETGLAKDATLSAAKTDLDNLATHQTDGTQKSIARGGAKGATTAADVTSTSIDADHQALDVAVKASALPTGAATEATLATRAADATITARLGTLGQKAMAGSAPVVIANDQSAIPVSGTVAVSGTISGAVSYSDSANLDASGRLRVSNPQTLFDSKQLIDAQSFYWDDAQTSGSGTSSTYSNANASSTLAVSNTTAGTRVRQTIRRFNYEPGKSQLIVMTGTLAPEGGQAGNTRRMGQFDGNNGLFWQVSGTTVSFVERKGGVDTVTTQANWNVDKLDGTGASGLTLDITKQQIFFIDYQWLGTGRVRFGFIIGGKIIVAHQSNHANVVTSVYISNPNLPLRYEISNSGTGAAGSIVHVCTTVITEGGQNATGITVSADRGATSITTGNDTNIYPLLVLRLQSTKQMADITLESASVISTTTAASFRLAVYIGRPTDFTFAGAALSFSPVSNSAVEVALPAASNLLTVNAGATQVYSEYATTNKSAAVNAELASSVRLGSLIDGTSTYAVLAIQPVPANGALTMFGAINWQEEL
jgi:hypothetical protein